MMSIERSTEMTEPYKAYKDSGLFKLLNSLNRASIHPQHIETDGSLLVKISSYYDLDIVADCYINEDGITFNDREDVMSELTIGTDTLLQLADMSTCFAAGYAKARQEHEEKQANENHTNSHST